MGGGRRRLRLRHRHASQATRTPTARSPAGTGTPARAAQGSCAWRRRAPKCIPRDANPRGTHPGPRGHSLETPSHVGLCPREHKKAEPADGDRAYLRGPRYRADRTSAESLKLTKKVKTPVSVSVFALAPGKPFSSEK